MDVLQYALAILAVVVAVLLTVAPLIHLDAAPRAGPQARLYDADGQDREVELANRTWPTRRRRPPAPVDRRARGGQRERPRRGWPPRSASMEPDSLARLADPPKRADLTQYRRARPSGPAGHRAAERCRTGDSDPAGRADRHRRPAETGCVTVHDGPLAALDRFDAEREGETRLGALDAGELRRRRRRRGARRLLRAGRGDRARDRPARRARAPRASRARRPCPRSSRLRRRIGLIRRTLAPHRVAFAALTRPDMDVDEELGARGRA